MAKLQPGLLESKHFLVITYPWTNSFDTLLDGLFGADEGTDELYRERFRKLSGGSIISPFEYGLSMNDTYSLYLTYRLTQKEYFEQKFTIDYNEDLLDFYYMSDEMDAYVDELEADGEVGLSVYYFNKQGLMVFLDESHYELDTTLHKVRLLRDGNELVTPNSIKEFYIGFAPEFNDKQFMSHTFSYDPTGKLMNTINVEYWSVENGNRTDIVPNLDAMYFIDEELSSPQHYTCRATQIGATLQQGTALVFDLAGELGWYDSELLDGIQHGEYISLHAHLVIKNYEVLNNLTVEFYEGENQFNDTDVISIEELIDWDFNLQLDLPPGDYNLTRIKIIPGFKNEDVFDPQNTVGFPRYEFLEWTEDRVITDDMGNDYYVFQMENPLFINSSMGDPIMVFDENFDILSFTEDIPLNWTVINENYDDSMYYLYIPTVYHDPETGEITEFQEGDLITIRYNSPVEKAITIGIEELYFALKPAGYSTTPYFTQVSFINASSEDAFDEFTTPYSYDITIPLTPFDTFDSGRYMSTIIELNFTQFEEFLVDGYLDFSHLLITVPYPTHELVLKEIAIFSQSAEPVELYESEDFSTWQYTQLEILDSGSEPENDQYELELEVTPIFYDSTGEWLDYIEIADEDGNYYSAGIVGDQYQLYWDPQTGNFTWNEAFNQYPDYWGIEMELPMMVEPNTTLYFRYCTVESWMAPFDLHFEDIDYGSIDVVFDYDYLLSPEHEYWYGNYFTNNESDYRIEQFYSDSFSVYGEDSSYTHEFDIGPYNLGVDFLNLSLYKVVGMYFNLTEKELMDDEVYYNITFSPEENKIIVSDLDATDGLLNEFDAITIILNFTSGPVSSFTRFYMTSEFNSTYLDDIENSFFSTTSFNFAYSSPQADMLFGEDGNTLASDYTTFVHCEYNPLNSLDANDPHLENFKKYVDPYHVIYTADLNMDGVVEYKEEIDVDKDGKVDITRYGIDNEAATEEEDSVLWYRIVQDFSGVERYYDNKQGETTKTEWFDIADTGFAFYHFDIMALLGMIFNPFSIATLFLPELDFWAKKSVSQQFITHATTETQFYSITEDTDLDGFEDITMAYEKSTTVVYNEVENTESTIIAAKPQNLLYFITNYICSSWNALFDDAREDSVFNEQLSEEMLITGEFSEEYLEKNSLYSSLGTYLTSTYTKFTKESMKSYIDKQEEEKITITQWEEGEITETRIYTNEYDGSFFDNEDVDTLILMNIDSEQEFEISEAQTTDYLTDKREGWVADSIPEYFDQLTVYTDITQESYNLYSKTITISIPGRFSAYSDHLVFDETKATQDTQFTVSGVLITPEDGLVYYTSDKDLFKTDGGKGAKTQGHYLYYDSDLDGFGETVFVLAPDPDYNGVYEVMAVGFNYDGSIEFAPYTKVDVSKEVILNDNFYTIFTGRENERHGNWVYNFNNLKSNKLIFPPNTYDGYELKDSLFEVYKLAEVSKQESKYPLLFYEARHEAYDKAWLQYGTQFWKDVGDQVFSTLVAGSVSIAIIAAGWGFSTPLAHIAYFVIYSLLSKFQMDMKAHEADAYQKSQTFYPEGAKHDAPTDLSQKPYWDGFWGDSMPTALAGHPGAYFTTIYGGTPGNEYSAQAIAAPPNAMRQWELGNFGGVMAFIGANFNPFSFGRANPDLFTPLDFDHHNLDYQLVSSELYGYNDIPSYNYVESETMVNYFLDGGENYATVHPTMGGGSYTTYHTGPEQAMKIMANDEYYIYRQNTLGYLTRAIKLASDGQFVGIKPYCEDGRPSYVFTESSQFMADLPLFEPLVVDGEAYERLEEQGKVDGYLIIDLRVDGASNTKGISPMGMSSIELEHYGAKIPLADQFGGFGYPIKNVTLYAMLNGVPIKSRDLTSDQYAMDGLGNLYLYSPVECLLPAFKDDQGKLIEISEIHYTCVTKIAKVIPDTGNGDVSSSALMQSVLYSIMDYMDVYTFGETTANMIAEVGYTQAMTITSTAITPPLLVLGAWATKAQEAATQAVTQAAVKSGMMTEAQVLAGEVVKATLKDTFKYVISKQGLAALLQTVAIKTVSGVVSETVEEIVIDGIVETFFQSLVTKLGGSADLGHWVSTLMTTARETKFFSSFFKTGGDTSQSQKLAQRLSLVRKTMVKMSLNAEFKNNQQINEQYTSNELELASIKHEATLSLKKLLKAGLLIGLSLVMPSLAGLNLYAITKTLGGTINQAYASHAIKPQVQALATRNVVVSGEALTRSVVNIESLFGEKPVISEDYIDISSLFEQPSIEVMSRINNPLIKESSTITAGIIATSMVGLNNKITDAIVTTSVLQIAEKNEKDKIQQAKKQLEKVTSQSVSNEISIQNREIEENVNFLEEILNVIQNTPNKKGRKAFTIIFKGMDLKSSLDAVKTIDLETLNVEEVIDSLRELDPRLDFGITLADRKSQRSADLDPDGKVLFNDLLSNAFATNLFQNLESSTDMEIEELKKIAPPAYNDIKNYLEKSRSSDNRQFAEKYIQGSFFEMLMTYYLKFELPAQLWRSYIDRMLPGSEVYGMNSLDYFNNKYFQLWNDDAKNLQRIIWGVLLDFRNPYNGEKIQSISDWMSLDLHHWKTSEGVENKYECYFAALIPLPKSQDLSSFVHNDITNVLDSLEGEAKIEKGTYWEKEFAKRLSAIFQGEIPGSWSSSSKEHFDTYLDSPQNSNARRLISWFLLNPYIEMLKLMNLNPSIL